MDENQENWIDVNNETADGDMEIDPEGWRTVKMLEPLDAAEEAEKEARRYQLWRDRIRDAASIFEDSERREFEKRDPDMLEYVTNLTPSDDDLSPGFLESPAGLLLMSFADWMNASPEDFMQRAGAIAEEMRLVAKEHGRKASHDRAWYRDDLDTLIKGILGEVPSKVRNISEHVFNTLHKKSHGRIAGIELNSKGKLEIQQVECNQNKCHPLFDMLANKMAATSEEVEAPQLSQRNIKDRITLIKNKKNG